VIAEGIAGVVSVDRNRLSVSDLSVPAIIINEGDEQADDGDPDRRPPTAPRRVHMQPQMVIAIVDNRDDVGTELNALRAKVIKAVCTDATLRGYTHDDTGVRYLGMTSDLAVGRQMSGQYPLNFSLTYILKPAAL
jgi:hypothetical protein